MFVCPQQNIHGSLSRGPSLDQWSTWIPNTWRITANREPGFRPRDLPVTGVVRRRRGNREDVNFPLSKTTPSLSPSPRNPLPLRPFYRVNNYFVNMNIFNKKKSFIIEEDNILILIIIGTFLKYISPSVIPPPPPPLSLEETHVDFSSLVYTKHSLGNVWNYWILHWLAVIDN